jgi:hypothetical protein
MVHNASAHYRYPHTTNALALVRMATAGSMRARLTTEQAWEAVYLVQGQRHLTTPDALSAMQRRDQIIGQPC